jgi:hypothetical protein
MISSFNVDVLGRIECMIPAFLVILYHITGSRSLALEFSSLSGVVTRAVIGVQDHLYVALDFTTSESKMYSPKTCPPFLTGCYDPKRSAFFIQRANKPGGPQRNIINRSKGRDSIRVGSIALPDFAFSIWQREKQLTSPQYRDVHGVLGAGRSSVLFSNRIMEFYEQESPNEDKPVMRDVGSIDSPKLRSVVFTPSVGMERWVFQGSLKIGETEIIGPESELEINPSVADIVFPVSIRDAVIDALQESGKAYIDEWGRLRTCGSISITVTPQWSPWMILALKADQIVRKDLSNTEDRTCHLSWVRFSGTVGRVTLGRPFTRSVGRIVFDYKEGQIGFDTRPETTRPSTGFSLPPARIPIFSLPRLSETGFIDFPLGNDLVLLSSTDGLSWKFLRVEPQDGLPVSTDHMVASGADRMIVSTEPDGTFRFTCLRDDSGKSLRVSLIYTSDSVTILLESENPSPPHIEEVVVESP